MLSRASNMLLASGAPRAGELVLAGALLACLAAAVFGSNVAHGGFYVDDRMFYSSYQVEHGFFSGIGGILDSGSYGFRPLLAVQMAVVYAVFGLHPEPHLVLSLVLAVVAALCFYALLRNLSVERLHAGLIASLALISPTADSTKLWPAVGHNNMAVALYFAGAAAAVAGFRSTGRRATVLQGMGLAFYAMSILTYETAAVAMLCSVVLYRLCVPWRRAVRRWLLDVALVGALLILDGFLTDRTTPSLSDQVDVAKDVVRDAVSLVLSGGVPHGPRYFLVPVLLLLLGAGISTVVWPGWREDPAIRTAVRRWLVTAAVASVGIAAAYLMTVPGGDGLEPLLPGIGSRGNLLAVFGITTLLYSVLMLIGTLVLRSLDRWREASIAFALAIAVWIGIGYAVWIDDDKAAWAEAAQIQETDLDRLHAALPEVPAGSAIYSAGTSDNAALGGWLPGLKWWDLYGAGRVIWGPSVRALLIPAGTTWSCGPDGVHPNLSYSTQLGDHFYATDGQYGKSYVLDLKRGQPARIDDRAQCRRVTAALERTMP